MNYKKQELKTTALQSKTHYNEPLHALNCNDLSMSGWWGNKTWSVQKGEAVPELYQAAFRSKRLG